MNGKKEKKKPLIIFGARQVGKTYLVEQFAKENYDYFYSINFEFDKDAKELFSGNSWFLQCAIKVGQQLYKKHR